MASKKNLIIVESPSKAKTIEKFLGSKYKVIASKGHIRDLPKSRMAVNIENDFEPEYINVRGKADVIKEIKAAAKDCDKVFLATDPDREGEAIAWHICNVLGIEPSEANRIEFHEITKSAVTQAVNNPQPINMNLVDAQQGRRVTDRIVGYGISPVLWAKVGKGLSAGRVQSVALKIICDREDEIEEFDPKKYWAISVDLTKPGKTAAAEKKAKFTARLDRIDGKKVIVPDEKNEASIGTQRLADEIVKDLEKGKYTVSGIENKETQTRPYAPYTTSSLQQDASVRLNFAPSKTMMIAQQLYEGISVKGHGTVGLITYMRTDSVRISPEADAACKSLISNQYGKEYIGNNVFTNKRQNTQNAHEAIRPSYVDLTPDETQSSLTADQQKLYKLIWSRFVASRMSATVYDSCSVDIDCGKYGLRANGRKLKFDGFLKVYSVSSDDKDKTLPSLEKDEELKMVEVKSEARETEPPSRFTEASLIRELEEKGIGRPSTYAPIVSTLVERRYVKKEKKILVPTDLGRKITNDIMKEYFKDVVDINFTSGMEENLDKVAEGQLKWKDVVSDYYAVLEDEIKVAKEQAEKVKPEVELVDEICPNCGRRLAKKHSKYGDFLACTGFPECRYTKSIVTETGVKCPKCGGDIIVKRSRKGKSFYGCSNYPECDQVYWYKPVDKKCPKCGSLLVERGRMLYCSNNDCDYKEKK